MKTKRGILGLFLALCVVWSMLPLGAFAEDENAGDEPTHISTAEDLRAINGNLDGDYVLDGDIDLTDYLGGGSWTPIGTENVPFTGTFDGNGHSITGLYINASDSNYQGLFGYVGPDGTVKNLTVSGTVSVSVIGIGFHIGGVVGQNNGGIVTNCHNTVEVSGSSSGDESDSIFIGGVVGYNSSGTITNCSNTSTVSGSGNIHDNISVGGVVGENSGTITNCFNTGTVSGNGSVSGIYGDSISVGGVVGVSRGGTVTNCYNTGTVSSDNSAANIGGVVGYFTCDDDYKQGTVINCYNAGTVDGSARNAGGVVGFELIIREEVTVTNCYNTGAVRGGSYVGGVVGYVKNSIPEEETINCVTNCYYMDTQGPGIGGSALASVNPPQPLSAEDFANKNSFPSDWFNSTWEMSALLGRPILRSNREGGSGTLESPYEIPDLATLEYYRDKMNDTTGGTTSRSASYVLTDDIEMSGKYGEGEKSWTPIGTSRAPFTGTFDGNGHSIKGLYVYVSEILYIHYQGLFGYVGSGGRVQNLTISGNVSGAPNSSVGGVVGYNDGGTIENCKFEGSIRGTTNCFAGGVVGQNNGGTVKNCSNTGTVSGTDTSAGGVVGENYGGTVTNCHNNTGTVSGDDNPAGGVVGENSGTVENCSNTGKVSGTGGIRAPAGGVVGENRGTVENCYNTGTVSGDGSVGGVAGENSGTVANCYYEESKAGSGIGNLPSNENAESKDVDAFKSGEVAWLLQDGQDSDIWGQRLAEEADPYPVLTAFDADAPQVFKVTFMNGENEFAAAYANSGGKVSAPNPAPTNEGHQFVGWYSGETEWDFNTEVISDLTLTASWRQLSSNAGVKSVTVKGTAATPGENNTFTVTLPAVLLCRRMRARLRLNRRNMRPFLLLPPRTTAQRGPSP